MTVDVKSLVTDNLDLWSSTIKKKNATGRGSSKKTELYGIKKLRELILELAVRGLLVPQDPSDEPASVLLKKISVEKERLVKEKRMKKEKPLPEIGGNELPFALPEKWVWSRMGYLAQYQKGYAFKSKDYLDSGLMITKIQNLSDNNIKKSVFIPQEMGLEFAQYLLNEGDIVMTTVGSWFSAPASAVGRSFLVSKLFDNSLLNQNAVRIRSLKGLESAYLFLCISSPIFKNYLALEAQGTANQASITQTSIKNFLIGVPPKNEQHRIVTKVSELMTLCDQLEQQQENSISTHQILVETLLNTLTQVDNGQDANAETINPANTKQNRFQQAWALIADNFDHLFTTEHSIQQLKQTILQLAVMGKLVPQDPNDEPASVLLEKIAAEKSQLIKDKKIKKQKPLPPIGEEEKPFALPVGWEFCRFFDVNTVKSELVPALDFPNEWQVAPDSIEKNTGRLLENRTVAEVGAKGPNNRFYSGQILYSKIRPSLNKVVIAPYDGLCSADMYPINCATNSDYVLRYMLSENFLCQVRRAENRVKMPKLNLESLGMFIVALPPINEQKLIVTKVNELMTLCDNMLEHINAAQTTQLNLTDAIAEQALTK